MLTLEEGCQNTSATAGRPPYPIARPGKAASPAVPIENL